METENKIATMYKEKVKNKNILTRDEILEWVEMDQDFSFEYLDDESIELVCDDKEIVMLAVVRDYNLEFASDRLKDDEEVVLLACDFTISLSEIHHASKRLKNDLKFLQKLLGIDYDE